MEKSKSDEDICDTENIALQEVVYQPTLITNGPLKSAILSKSRPGYLYLSVFIGKYNNALIFLLNWTGFWLDVTCNGEVARFWTKSFSMHIACAHAIKTSEISLIAGIISLGSALGPFVSGTLAKKVGRKFTLLGLSLPFILSFVSLAYTSSVYVYYFARFVKGFCIGGSMAVIPMYIAEIAEDHNRGTLGCVIGVALSLGVLYAFLVGPILSIKIFSLSCTIAPILFFVLGYFIVPESPVYLASKGDKEGVKKTLMKLRSRGEDEVYAEVSGIMRSWDQDDDNSKGGYKSLFTNRGDSKALKITTGLLILQQMSGMPVVQSFLETIFKSAGGSIPSDKAPIIIAIIQLLISILTTNLAERLGRKTLMLISTAGTSISLIIIGIFFYFQNKGYNFSTVSLLPIISLVSYTISYSLGLSGIPWVIIGETFSSKVKFQASTFLTCFCFIASFVITFFFPNFSEFVGMAATFWVFGAFCAVGIIFVACYMPETKGKSLSEIQTMLRK
ncbi:unnamed protein product [Brassicogethes aeneus]|uniref:Major facilitator superfamily (MFS) profile domain-containing protein n=1 Tax=Brassicogethes aeneus TaxID=1431903 RepID=A0A9P0BKN1_BRAAE|nr:unnamed protein product [Brassicogethes aeneus]